MDSRISVDFQNANPEGRVRLNTRGTQRDLERLGLTLTSGMKVLLADGELETEGEVVLSAEEGIWVAQIDWRAQREM